MSDPTTSQPTSASLAATATTSSPGRLPTFIIIGVQKSGTTSIYNYLKQHPQIFMSPVKETNFFEREWAKEPPEVLAKRKTPINTLADYCRLFSQANDKIALGEASPNYMFHHQRSVELIHAQIPDAKLIAVLRNPVERAYSDYLMHVRDAVGQQHRPLDEQVKTRGESSYTLLKGKYYEPLKHFIDRFGADQVKVFLYDDLRQDAIAFMQQMYDFIGVDASFTPDTSRQAQTAQVPKNQTLNRLMKTQNPFRSAVSSLLRVVLPQSARRGLRSLVINLNSNTQKQDLSPEARTLLQNYYRDDILQLQALIQRDLSAWLQ